MSADLPDGGLDWDGVENEMACRIYDLGEKLIEAQFTAAIAADSRATTIAGMAITLALAVLGGGLAYWDRTASVPLLVASLTSGALLITSAATAAWTGRPQHSIFPGTSPAKWWPVRHSDLITALGGETESIQRAIVRNDKQLDSNGHRVRLAMKLMVSSPATGAAAWWIASAAS